MAEFNDTYSKAGILMTSALKKYEQGDIEGGDKDRAMANELYDKAESQVDATAMLYGENRNFGTIYKIFESNASSLFKNKNKWNVVRKIVKLIKEDKTLNKEFNVYKTLVYAESVKDADKYVNEAVSLIQPMDKKEIIKSNQKLIDLIHEEGINESVNISVEDAKLFGAVEYVLLNKEGLSNINEYIEAKDCIREHIEKNCKYSDLSEKDIDSVYNTTINEMADKYDSTLNENEKMLVEKLSRLENKESYFDMAKLDTIKTLNEQLDECEDENREGLQKIIENITNKEYNETKFIADAAEFREIKNTLIQEQTMSKAIVQTLATELAKKYRGEPSRNEDWIIGELTYNTPDDVDTEKIVKDVKELSQRYNPEDVGYMVISNMMAGNYRGFWTESKEHGVNEEYTPSDSFEGYAVDDNGGMLPINNLKMIVTFAATHPEYFDQLPPEIKKSVEDARKYFEEHPDIDWELQK